MAQVKKFNTGGSVQKMKYGNIIKNGTTYEMTEESMKRLEQYIAAADPDIQQSLANDWKLLMSGQDITIDTMANRRSTVPEDFTKGQLKRLGKDKATESKWHDAVNSDIHKYNLATQYLGKFDPSKSYKIEETPQKDFWKSNKSIEYDIEDDGTKKYRGLSNTDEKNYFNEIIAYLMGDAAFRAQYKDPGISNFETLDSWFKSLPNPEEFAKNLWNKIENGQELNSDESQFWDAIEMKFGDPKANPKYDEKVKGDEAQAVKEKAWEAFNVGNVWDDSEMNNDYFVYNPTTGTFIVKMPTLDGKSTGYYFNQDFLDSYYGYDHLKGKINFNGKWYHESDLSNPESELYKMLNHGQYDYYNKNRRGDINAVDAVLKTYWNNKMVPVNNPETANYSGNFYQNSNYLYEPLNYNTKGTTYKGFAIPEDWSIFKRIDLTDKTADATGRRKVGYIMIDAYGNIVTDIPNVGPIQDMLNYLDFTGLNPNPVKAQLIQSNDLDSNMVSNSIQTSDSNFVNVSAKELLERDIKRTFKNMPVSVYNAITDPKFVQLRTVNPYVKRKFEELLLNVKYSVFNPERMTVSKWKDLGLENAEEVVKYFKNYYKNTIPSTPPNYFKQGGVLKAQDGLDYLETPYTKKLKQLYDIELNPNGMITGSAPTGIGIDKPTDPTKSETSFLPIETEIIEFPSMFKELDNDYYVDLMGTKRQATQHAKKFAKDHPGFAHFWWGGKKYGLNGKSYGWGQNPSKSLKPWIVPTAVDALMSSARLGFDRKTNEIITAQKAKGIREAADASMLSKQGFIPQKMQLTAGYASKAAANRMLQHLPPVNSDYIKYAAQQRAGFDAANAMLAQSDREYSAQYSENLDKNISRQQMIADRNMQIEVQNRQIQAQKMAALSELYASRDAANRQSIANYGIEQQTKYEQGMQKAREAHLARERSKWAIDAQKMYIYYLTKDIDIKSAYDAYLATNPTIPLTIENWVASEPRFRNKVNEYMQKVTQWIADQQLETELSYLPPIYKSGGKMRSASDQIAINREKANDQIKVNKYKSFDKNWEDQNKAVRKAIGKMHDRVYNILMKILS